MLIFEIKAGTPCIWQLLKSVNSRNYDSNNLYMAAAEVCSNLKLRQEHVVAASCGTLFVLESSFAFSACAWLSKIELILTLYKRMFPVSDIPNRCKSLKLTRHST